MKNIHIRKHNISLLALTILVSTSLSVQGQITADNTDHQDISSNTIQQTKISTKIKQTNKVKQTNKIKHENISIDVLDEVKGLNNSNSERILVSNLNEALVLNQMGAAVGRFVMFPSAIPIRKSVSPTTPPKHICKYRVNLMIGDVYTGNLLGETVFIIKGIGNSEFQAEMAAIRRINSRNYKIKKLILNSQKKVIEYFDSEGPTLLQHIKVLINKKEYKSAMIEARVIPKTCIQWYNEASKLISQLPTEKVNKIEITQEDINKYYNIDDEERFEKLIEKFR
ncbi:MAG: hypothetical protein WC140_04560 [Bacteroidales bacterium]